MDAIAKAVVDVLGKSGCVGQRVARAAEPPPPPPNNGSATPPPDGGSAAPPPDESHRADAEALNDQGKDKLQNADMQGALALFQQANQLLPDAKYAFNTCLAFEALEQWANAIAACKQARGMNPEARLVTKIDHRLDLLSHHQ
jgi:tetratricopeptide (TPR) repeat protein